MGELLLVIAGLAVMALGVAQARGPLATIRRLDEARANLDRYDTWRGKRASLEPEGPTGADVMRDQMRQRLILWGVVIGVGVVMVLAGLLFV